MTILFEAGGVGPGCLPCQSQWVTAGLSTRVSATSMDNIMSILQRGAVDMCFIGGAQIDKYGNINSTVIGDYYRPKVRLPGSGGANDLASLSWQSICMVISMVPGLVRKQGCLLKLDLLKL